MGSYFLCISIKKKKKKVSKFVQKSHFGLVIDIHSAVPIFGCLALKTFFSASQSAFSSSKSAGCRTVRKARGGAQAQPRGNHREGNEPLILNFWVPGATEEQLDLPHGLKGPRTYHCSSFTHPTWTSAPVCYRWRALRVGPETSSTACARWMLSANRDVPGTAEMLNPFKMIKN